MGCERLLACLCYWGRFISTTAFTILLLLFLVYTSGGSFWRHLDEKFPKQQRAKLPKTHFRGGWVSACFGESSCSFLHNQCIQFIFFCVRWTRISLHQNLLQCIEKEDNKWPEDCFGACEMSFVRKGELSVRPPRRKQLVCYLIHGLEIVWQENINTNHAICRWSTPDLICLKRCTDIVITVHNLINR